MWRCREQWNQINTKYTLLASYERVCDCFEAISIMYTMTACTVYGEIFLTIYRVQVHFRLCYAIPKTPSLTWFIRCEIYSIFCWYIPTRPTLLTMFNFIHIMHKWLHPYQNIGYCCLSIHKRQLCSRIHFGRDKYFYEAHYWEWSHRGIRWYRLILFTECFSIIHHGIYFRINAQMKMITSFLKCWMTLLIHSLTCMV